MESPVAAVKSAINPGTIIKTFLGIVVVAAILDVLGFTDVLIRPVTFLKAKFAKAA